LHKQMPAGAMGYLEHALNNWDYTTAFSGIDAPGTSLAVHAATLSFLLGRGVGGVREPTHKLAVECYKPSQNELKAHPTAAPNCLHTDQNGYWKPSVKAALDKLKANGTPLNKVVLLPLIRQGRNAVNLYQPCLMHSARGPSSKVTCDVPRARVHIAGIECKDWSPRGSNKGSDGQTFQTFACWATVAVAMRHKTIVVKCSHRYRARMLYDIFGKEMAIMFVQNLCASHLGNIGSRPRFWAVLLSRLEIVAVWSSLNNVVPMFYRTWLGSIAALLIATEEEKDAELAPSLSDVRSGNTYIYNI
jgi:hypothetical protein